MNEHKSVNEWLTLATGKIRFGPDRKAVSAELQEHIEDKILDICRIYPDMPEEAAVKRALGQMGDAEEVGRELGKIHKPWLGYLWWASQVFLVIMVLIALHWAKDPLWRVAPISNWKEHVERYDSLFPDQLPARTEFGPIHAIGAGAETVSIGTYTIEVRRASIIDPEDNAPFLYFTMRIYTDKPWELPDRDIGTWISVSDSAGYYWSGHRERDQFDGKSNTTCSWTRSGLTWKEYEGYVFLYSYNEPVRYIPERPWEQTYTIHYNNGVTSFDIPIVWEVVSP